MGFNPMQQMLAQAQKMQRDLKKAQDELALQDFEVSKGGIVKVIAKGDMTISKIEIDKDALSEENQEMIEDALKMALQEVFDKIENEKRAINEKVTGRPEGLGM